MKELSPEAAELRDLFEDTLGRVGATTRLVAEQIGMSQTALSGFLRGANAPRKSSLAKIKRWCDEALDAARRRETVAPIERLPMHPQYDRLPRDDRNWKKRP